MQSAFSWAPKVARKCESKHWYACGADGRSVARSVGHVITKCSGMGRFIYPWCSACALRARSSANNFFVWLVVTSLIRNRSPRLSFLHDPQCVTFPHEKSQSICVSVVAELFNGVRNELALLLGRANNL